MIHDDKRFGEPDLDSEEPSWMDAVRRSFRAINVNGPTAGTFTPRTFPAFNQQTFPFPNPETMVFPDDSRAEPAYDPWADQALAPEDE